MEARNHRRIGPKPWRTTFVLYVAGSILLLIFVLSMETIADFDLWGRLSVPAIALACHQLPTHDYFSFTAYGAPWIDHEWMSGFFFYGLLTAFGSPGLTLFKWFLASAMLLTIWRVNRNHAAAPLLVFVLMAACIPSIRIGFGATARAQNFTFLFIALQLWLLETLRRGGNRHLIWLLIPLNLLWANIHAGFVVGVGISILYAAGAWCNRQEIRPYLGAAAVALGTSLINPYGLRYWQFIAHAITLRRPEILEWSATSPLNPVHWAFTTLAMLMVLTVGCAVWRHRARVDWSIVFVIMATMIFGWRAVKHQMLFAIATTTLAPKLIADTWPSLFRDRGFAFELENRVMRALIRMVLPALIALSSLAGIVFSVARQPLPLHAVLPHQQFNPLGVGRLPYPVAAARFLAESGLEGNLLAPFGFSEFLLFTLYPHFRVAVDGRLEEVYPAETYRPIMAFFSSPTPDWDQALSWKTQFVLWPEYAVPLDFSQVPDHLRPIYRDGEYIILADTHEIQSQGYRPPSKTNFAPGHMATIELFFDHEAQRSRFQTYCREPLHKAP